MAMPPEMVVWLELSVIEIRKTRRDVHGRTFIEQKEGSKVEQESQDIGDHGHEEDKLGELVGSPCAFEIASAVEDGETRDDEAQDILLDDGGQGEDPRVEDGLHRDDGEVGHAIADANNGLLDLFDPVGVGAQGEVEQGEDNDGGEQAAGQRRQVNPGHTGGGRSSVAAVVVVS